MKRLAVLAAAQSDGYIVNNNMTSFTGARAGPSLHGNVNVLLSGWVYKSGAFLITYFHRKLLSSKRDAYLSKQFLYNKKMTKFIEHV